VEASVKHSLSAWCLEYGRMLAAGGQGAGLPASPPASVAAAAYLLILPLLPPACSTDLTEGVRASARALASAESGLRQSADMAGKAVTGYVLPQARGGWLGA
jgi:hypothetical protein